ncbi:MAG: ArsR family transcriptional regulator [Anaerolineales bacterium]|nr:ArsR family transcriptional regulator [Anaerolineales bacterium]
MTTARQKVLAHLKKTRAASAREIARALKMSAPNVRHHLAILCSDGRLETTEIRLRDRRGRPEKLYSLSQAALGDNLAKLADALLAEESLKSKVEGLASRMLDASQFANLPITKRLTLLVEKLDAMNYQARWEAAAEGPRVIFGRCPYAKIIEGHPELCKIDKAMLESALGKSVTEFTKMESKIYGICPLAFQVG